MKLREIVLLSAHDAGTNFAVYDRKEDEQLSHEQLARAVERGDVTLAEIAEQFTTAVREAL